MFDSITALHSKSNSQVLLPGEMQLLPEHTRRFFKLLDEHKFFSKKYWEGQREDIIMEVNELYEKQPDLPVKQVVVQILSEYPDFLPSWNIHQIVGYITQTWKELSQAEEAPEPEKI